MRRLKPRVGRRTQPGTKPGTLTIPADAQPTTLRVMAYNKERVLERELQDPHELRELVNQWPVVWVDVVGLGSEATLRAIADIFHIHPLALEDIVHQGLR